MAKIPAARVVRDGMRPRPKIPDLKAKSLIEGTTSKRLTAAATATALQAMFVDCYALDGYATLAGLDRTIAAGLPWAGIIMQGAYGMGHAGNVQWFYDMWQRARSGAGSRYGKTWFRAAYAFHLIGVDPIGQADNLLATIDKAGGFGDGDLWCFLDVERGAGQPTSATKQQVIDSVSTTALRILAKTGKRPIVYTGSWTRELGINTLMECWGLWYPQWARALNWNTVYSMGATQKNTLLWQDVGDGSDTAPPDYPNVSPMGRTDISILVRDNLPQAEGLAWLATHTGAQPVAG